MDLSLWCNSGRATSRHRSCPNVGALHPHPTSQSLDVYDVSVTAEVVTFVDGFALWTAVALLAQIARAGLLQTGQHLRYSPGQTLLPTAHNARRIFPLLTTE